MVADHQVHHFVVEQVITAAALRLVDAIQRKRSNATIPPIIVTVRVPVHRAVRVGNILRALIRGRHYAQRGHLIVIGAQVAIEIAQAELAVELEEPGLVESSLRRLEQHEIIGIYLSPRRVYLFGRQQSLFIQSKQACRRV